ncbi:MAG: uracil-DNA glycosylase [Gammaproteobacteria bacterium]|nr:uracil-DNA glycosylase [Gammaproteobacteria bacterium]
MIESWLKLSKVDESWLPLLHMAFDAMDENYLNDLQATKNWLPGVSNVLAAFSQPMMHVRYVLLGESPYPRQESANGYAFWDAAVQSLWSENGLSKNVNRATSLRNFMKMLLNAEGVLKSPFASYDIATLNKNHYIQTLPSLFQRLMDKGFILLNASLVWSEDKPMRWHAKHWYPFMHVLLDKLSRHEVKFLLFGKIAQQFKELPSNKCLVAEHPYVLSFIENSQVLKFFQPFHLLRA